ncbi:TrfA protein [Nitrosospira multiformis]|uniref:TrfA protein n=1 Tax=Nitrosospira multiformis TaxID=1231 RepID=A0A2T5IH37_9PROT|nr:plasmid replication initiator TrfA [Nitrosospira multiformis]PTQ83153.1 TrfA protein [Nitrosospira multiformis]
MTKKNKPLDEMLGRMKKKLEERERNAVVQLPLWPEPKRGAPNSFIRSALFAAIQSKDRQYIKEAVLASQDGITVKFTGEQLNQADLDVWETIVHMARDQPLGTFCSFTAHGLLKAMGMPTGNSQHKQLHSTLLRLTACAVEVTHEGKTYFGPLIKSGAKDELTRHYGIELNKGIIRLFGENQWTALDWKQRQELRGQPLAQALHAFYSSHREPFAVKLETLQAYTGSRNKQTASFKRQVRTALGQLVGVGFLSSYEFEGDLVRVQRTSTPLVKRA